MKLIIKAFTILQTVNGIVNGLVYAGYKPPTKVAGIKSLDRYRCGENHVGFEYTGYMISTDGSCVGIPYGWSGAVPADSEWIQKTWNCNKFNIPVSLLNEHGKKDWYKTQNPVFITTGSRSEVVFEPQDPWNQIVCNLFDEDEIDIIIHVSFRKDFNKIQFNSRISGTWISNLNANNVEISTDNTTTLTLEILSNAIKVSVNGIEKYSYTHRLDPEEAGIIYFHPSSGSNCLLKRVCFYGLKPPVLVLK